MDELVARDRARKLAARRPMTYVEEMRARFPNRPYAGRPTWELRNIKRALSMLTVLNTAEEDQRLADVTAELAAR